MLSHLLSHRCPFRCQHNRTDDGTHARCPDYCPTVPLLSRRLSRRPVIFLYDPNTAVLCRDNRVKIRLLAVLLKAARSHPDTARTSSGSLETGISARPERNRQ